MPEQETELQTPDAAAREKESTSETGGSEHEAQAREVSQVKSEGTATEEAAPVSRAEFEKLRADYGQLTTERDQLLDRLARSQAEFENARKRAEREKQEFRDFAMGSVVEKFLPVLDNFELALKSSGTTEQLRSGVELIVKQMEEVLRQMQVQPIAAVGEAFDPRQHEALGSVEREDLPDQHVAEEVRRGYKLRDRLLRPALVRVASNPKQTND